MESTVEGRDALDEKADCYVFGLFERSEGEKKVPQTLVAADSATKGLITASWERNEIRGKRRDIALFPFPGGQKRVALLGLGKKVAFEPDAVRTAFGVLARGLKGKGVKSISIHIPSFVLGKVGPVEAGLAAVDGHALGSYEFTRYKSERTAPEERGMILALGKEHKDARAKLTEVLQDERKLLDCVTWTRDVGNLPADVATPEYLAGVAVKLAQDAGLKVTVFDEKKLKSMGCGGILAVGGGSIHPPRLVILEYAGPSGKNVKTVAVVGKGITFDSGGISIKPAPSMSEMKFDKSGAVAVMGIMKAAAELKVPARVIGVMSFAENLPGGSAYRPGDVVKAFNGKTIDILNTDAEGRVVLSDALSYAVATYDPDEVIDLATLTGACVVALGVDTAGLMTTDDTMATQLLASSEATGEKIWRLPLTDMHREMVKGEVGDLRNSTELPMAGTLTAGAFLSEFVNGKPWAHLDIAGTGWVGKTGAQYVPSYTPSGCTGFGVRLITHYLKGR